MGDVVFDAMGRESMDEATKLAAVSITRSELTEQLNLVKEQLRAQMMIQDELVWKLRQVDEYLGQIKTVQ